MFAQVITGRVTDADGLRRQVDRWEDEVRPGADGFLGSTGGVTDDDRFVVVARFDTEESARRNSDRDEQSNWWAETEKCLQDVAFDESSDVTLQLGGGDDAAGFVQVMRGRIVDDERYERMTGRTAAMDELLRSARPDVLGGYTVRFADDRYADVVYFSSETAAREGEQKEMPDGMSAEFEEMMASVEVDEFIDLRDPWIH